VHEASRSRASAPRSSPRSSTSSDPRIKAAKRLAAPRIPIPFAPPLEAEVRVTPEKVVTAVKQLIAV
jgi:pyruvate dehydrogenase E1 component beta subunit